MSKKKLKYMMYYCNSAENTALNGTASAIAFIRVSPQDPKGYTPHKYRIPGFLPHLRRPEKKEMRNVQ